MQHNESSTLHALTGTPSGELIKGLVKAVKVAPNEKYEFFPRKIGALCPMCQSGQDIKAPKWTKTAECTPVATTSPLQVQKDAYGTGSRSNQVQCRMNPTCSKSTNYNSSRERLGAGPIARTGHS